MHLYYYDCSIDEPFTMGYICTLNITLANFWQYFETYWNKRSSNHYHHHNCNPIKFIHLGLSSHPDDQDAEERMNFFSSHLQIQIMIKFRSFIRFCNTQPVHSSRLLTFFLGAKSVNHFIHPFIAEEMKHDGIMNSNCISNIALPLLLWYGW